MRQLATATGSPCVNYMHVEPLAEGSGPVG
jgi:hypothetical protein